MLVNTVVESFFIRHFFSLKWWKNPKIDNEKLSFAPINFGDVRTGRGRGRRLRRPEKNFPPARAVVAPAPTKVLPAFRLEPPRFALNVRIRKSPPKRKTNPIEQVRLKRTIDKSPLDVVELRYHIKGVIVCRDNIQI